MCVGASSSMMLKNIHAHIVNRGHKPHIAESAAKIRSKANTHTLKTPFLYISSKNYVGPTDRPEISDDEEEQNSNNVKGGRRKRRHKERIAEVEGGRRKERIKF